MSMPDFQVKKKILAHLSGCKGRMVFGRMYFRLYNPQTDTIVDHYAEADWNLIFKDYKEDDMVDLQRCANVTILLWCDIPTNTPHGMIYLEESRFQLNEISFHGGTWDHSPSLFIEIYRSLVSLFTYLISLGIRLTTSCSTDNYRADKFQRSLGFVEQKRDDILSYKVLDEKIFISSKLLNKDKSSNRLRRN
jgi:hypothetical protein